MLVQQRQNADGRWETDFVASNQNGEPQTLYQPDGTLRWQAPKSTLWGQRPSSTEDPADPELAFAGQYRDTESGLCYNRFRYYDPAGGCYVSPDPIGVLGGEWKSGRTFKEGDSGLKDHAQRHSDLSPKKYLERGKKNVSHGSLLKGGGKNPDAKYYVRKLGDNDYSVTIIDKIIILFLLIHGRKVVLL
ncbi:RHS repeat-associated core domain-containing protein [Pectobacterium polaris]